MSAAAAAAGSSSPLGARNNKKKDDGSRGRGEGRGDQGADEKSNKNRKKSAARMTEVVDGDDEEGNATAGGGEEIASLLPSSLLRRLERGPEGVPPKDVVRALYDEVAKKDDGTDGGAGGEQRSLDGSGLLSLSEVLVPSVALQHDRFLMALQHEAAAHARGRAEAEHERRRKRKKRRLAKRRKKGRGAGSEAPEEATEEEEGEARLVQEALDRAAEPWTLARAALYDAAAAGSAAAERSRLGRIRAFRIQLEREEEERARAEQESKDKARRKREEKARIRRVTRPQRLRAARKKHPPNALVYHEHLHLAMELNKMDFEEEMWNKAKAGLDAQEAALASSSGIAAAAATAAEAAAPAADAAGGAASEETMTAAKHVEQLRWEIDRMRLSCRRVEEALGVVRGLVDESERTRERLYERYTSRGGADGTRFEGPRYASLVADPRAAVQALSQQSSASSTTAQTSRSAAAAAPASLEPPRA
jgi:hypothetical protein